MSIALKRFLTYSTLASYLIVGSAAIRFFTPKSSKLSVTTEYLTLFSKVALPSSAHAIEVVAPDIKFAAIKLPPLKAPVISSSKNVTVIVSGNKKVRQPVVKSPVKVKAIVKAKSPYELRFEDSVKVAAIKFENVEPITKISPEEALKDAVSTKLAQSSKKVAEDVEPVFFEYENDAKETAEINKVVENTEAKEIKVAQDNLHEEIAVEDLIAFDYAAANKDVAKQVMPSVASSISKVNNPAPTFSVTGASKSVSNAVKAPTKGHQAQSHIRVIGSNMKSLPKSMNNFEVRYQDDQAEAMTDAGTGQIKVLENMANSKMTRSMTILKNGFIPTTTDLIIEKGATEVSLPVIDEQRFDKLMAPYKGSVGAVLVELDDTTEKAFLDVSVGETIQLDGDLKQTKDLNFRYQMFLGVRAGNVMLNYKGTDGQVVSKIIHVHENEVTFDSNFYEYLKEEKVHLFEEDLLAKEKAPLIISGSDVKLFSTNTTARKLDINTYKVNFGKGHLGGRRYLELNHQNEPIFVGVRDNMNVTIPSESFIAFVLSKFEDSKLGNRCLVQVNLTKKAMKMEVGSESTAASLMTYTQVLDSDGKFYDSIGDKTQKIIIVGESQGSAEISKDAKINVKIEYQDGSSQYLNSYCSPNTYLVEQL